ncbi:5-methylcytosine-specific restriction protein A [Psychrobacter sp. PL15]|jgi:5-methylcytosine-specific restriction protein A|uniref:HNH endonuclease n=1 Tax=Psychrobacter sp. PL15 TaxID=3071719 RepID=UPI002DF81181|nr:5-methylcytosine-specific restriction protein A [Psychrobacter sp. PL15]
MSRICQKDNYNIDNRVDEQGLCELCGRNELLLTRHHLIPRSRHNKRRTQRNFSRDAMKADIAMLCRPCHSQVHCIFANHELASYYHTIERLKEHSEVQTFINWVKKRPAGLKISVRH